MAMKYKRIKISYIGHEDRLYRTILVKPEINLLVLGCIIASSFHACLKHDFLFRYNDNIYIPELFAVDDPYTDGIVMNNFNLSDFDDEFEYEYDTENPWRFKCSIYESDVEVKGNRLAVLIDGKGQGIWEDNRQSLEIYLNGKVDPDSDEEDEERNLHLPWNFKNRSYSDFDSYDLEKQKELFEDIVYNNLKEYLYHSHENGLNLEIGIDDLYDDEIFEDYNNSYLNKGIILMVEQQIRDIDYVKDTYRRLSREYGDYEAKCKIAGVLSLEILRYLSEFKVDDNSDYQMLIENLN